MSRKSILSASALLFLLFQCAASAEDGCDFDASGVSPPVLSKQSVKASAWDKQKLEYRALLTDGSVLFVKYWACEHWGLSAEMTVSADTDGEDSDEVLRGMVKTVAADILDKRLNAALVDALAKRKELAVGDDFDIPVDGVTEFTVSIQHVDVYTAITVSYYMS